MTVLNKKQTRFCEEYVVDLNATQAAIRAGYSERTAGAQGHELLKKLEIKQVIAEKQRIISEKTQITAEYVLTQAVKLHERCMQEVKPVMTKDADGHPEQATDENGALVFQFNATAAAKALEIVGKHIDVQAFSEKIEITGEGDMATLLNAGIKRAESAAGEVVH